MYAKDIQKDFQNTPKIVSDSLGLEITNDSLNQPRKIPTNICSLNAEDYTNCFRFKTGFFVLGTGLPTYYNNIYSEYSLREVIVLSLLNPAINYSFHKTGGWSHAKEYQSSLSLVYIEEEEVVFANQWLEKPITFLNWSQGVFGLNSFHLKLNRALTKNLSISILTSFNSVGSRKSYEYQSGVHQFYTDALKKDSSAIVFTGISPSISTWFIRPALHWFLNSSHSIRFYWELFQNNTNAASLNSDTNTVNSISHLEDNLISQKFESKGYGFIWFWNNRTTDVYLQFTHSSFKQKYESFSPFIVKQESVDTLTENEVNTQLRVYYSFESKKKENGGYYDFKGQSLVWTLRQWLNTDWRWSLSTSYHQAELFGDYVVSIPDQQNPQTVIPFQETAIAKEQIFSLRREYHQKKIKSQISLFKDNGLLQMEYKARYQWRRYLSGRLEQFGGFKAIARWYILNRWSVHGEIAFQPKFPNWKNLYVSNSILGLYPNPNLKSEKEISVSLKSVYEIFPVNTKHKTFVFWNIGGSIHLFHIKDAILPYTLPLSTSENQIVENSLALGLTNREIFQYVTWNINSKLRWGHGNVVFSYSSVLGRNSVKDKGVDLGENLSLIPSILKCQIFWEKRHIIANTDFHLNIGVHWESVGKRWMWQPLADLETTSANQNFSKTSILKPYHSIDFFTKLEIKTFVLYYQMKNLNHDRYFATLGTHPVGINFRWGITWRFDS